MRQEVGFSGTDREIAGRHGRRGLRGGRMPGVRGEAWFATFGDSSKIGHMDCDSASQA
jgi:hypothetical protein